MVEEVNYYSYGYNLWASLLIPDDYKKGERRAALVECPGYRHGVIDPNKLPVEFQGMGRISERLLESGYIILVPHCRGMGKSQGRPGHAEFPNTRLNPFEQLEDMRNAITYLQQRPEVDPDRIGAFGFSYGGALSPYLAAVDKRVKCCVGALGVGDGEEWMRGLRRDDEYRAFKERVLEDLRQQVLTGQPEFVDPLEIMIPDKDSANRLQALHKAFIADLRFTLDSAYYIMNFKTVDMADKVTCPLLIIGAEHDSLCPVEDFVKVYERANEPKRLVIIPEMTHYQTYLPENADNLATPLAEWFCQWLPAKQP